MINAVVFDVSETLVDESREYGTWADWLGVPRHTFSAERIRHRPAEIAAVTEHKARCFVITRGGLPSPDMAQRFITNKAAILTAAAEPGPYIYSVQMDRISRLYP